MEERYMSISSEISRIKKAKEDIITAIQSKGVNVDSNAKIDTLPNMISSIETGSGSGFTINGGKSVRINNSGGDIGAGSLIEIRDTASADVNEVKTDFVHNFDEYTNVLFLPDGGLMYGAIISVYQFTTTDFGLLIEYCFLGYEYQPIKKFLTPVMFKVGSATNAISNIKQRIHPAVLSSTRIVLAIGCSYDASGTQMSVNQVRIIVLDFDIPYKWYGADNANMTMIDQTFTFTSTANFNLWMHTKYVSSGTNRPYYYSMVTPIDQDTFMIPVNYSGNASNKIGFVVFKIENGSVRVVNS